MEKSSRSSQLWSNCIPHKKYINRHDRLTFFLCFHDSQVVNFFKLKLIIINRKNISSNFFSYEKDQPNYENLFPL